MKKEYDSVKKRKIKKIRNKHIAELQQTADTTKKEEKCK